jgi:DUF4097 and DUF4098 domain-containing protein YvlB
MFELKYRFRSGFRTGLAIVCLLPLAAAASDVPVERKVAADANGEVVISNVSGSVDVRGWDRNEIQVTGNLGADVERLDVESSGGRTVIKVVLPRGRNSDSGADLDIQVPRGSRVEASVVSADLSSRGVLGQQRLKSVSGEITADIAGDDSELRTVSGDLTIRGNGKPLRLRASSVSGNIDLTNAAGSVDVVTVSGGARLDLIDASDVRGRTTSGELELRAKLTRDGRVDIEGVSGDITLRVSAPNGFSTEIESFSGDIEGCLADGVERVSKYGPGTRLNIRTVEAGARVRAKTMSGDVDICDR